MKVFEAEYYREIDSAPAPILWNYWDHEHLYVVHQNYTNAHVLYDDEKIAVYLLTYKLPVFSFLTSKSLNIMIQVDPETIKAFNVGIFGIPVCTTVTVKEVKPNFSKLTINYKFILSGWKRILKFFLPKMTAKWNKIVWDEDFPIKLRRYRVLRMGFKDFIGLPKDIEDRVFKGDIPFELPVKRHKDSPVNYPL